MAIGTFQNKNQVPGFNELPQIDPGQLNLKIQLGYLSINPRFGWFQNHSGDFNQNPFHKGPGGDQGASFANSYLSKFKSTNLKTVTHGIMPSILEPGGAPFCTFIEGSISAETPHPYYNLIKAPADEIIAGYDSTANFSIQTPLIQTNNFQSFSQPYQEEFNKFGSPYIPSTTLTSPIVATQDLKPLETHNIWKIDNISKSQASNFNSVQFLGMDPKSGTQATNLQPYAQTWPFTDSSMIQVYSSSAQVSLTRKYPMAKDYAHHPDAKYLVYDGSSSEPVIQKYSTNLSQNYSKGGVTVGFTLVFGSVVAQNSNTLGQNSNGKPILVDPRIMISWGSLDDPNKYTKSGNISLYTLEISPNRSPRIYFNISNQQILNQNYDPSDNYQELKSLQPIISTQRNSGAKTANDYKLYVYYSGSYMYIGTGNEGTSPDKWETINYQYLQSANQQQRNSTNKSWHYLDETSMINISAQYMNFAFMYGPPLFNPHDDQNLPGLTNKDASSNTYNQCNGYLLLGPEEPSPDQDAVNQFMAKNQVQTFVQIDDVNTDLTNPNSKRYIFSSPFAYVDKRSTNTDYSLIFKDKIPYTPPNGSNNQGDYDYISVLHYKFTHPVGLGGHVYNQWFAPPTQETPSISESYVKYFPSDDQSLTDANGSPTSIEATLTQAVDISGFSITKNIDKVAVLKSKLSGLKFINLNKSNAGRSILNFMRQNVSVIKISAGYGKDLHVYFEGVIKNVKAHENLESTKIEVDAEDLLIHLFENKDTSILNRNHIVFPGMTYYDIIANLVYYTELKNHFDLSNINPSTLLYLNKTNLPKKAASFLNPDLASLEVKPYEPSQYFQVIQQICELSIQTNIISNLNTDFDIPIIYWYADQNNDGIKMASRNPVDKTKRDILFFRRTSITKDLINNIQVSHGQILQESGFQSESNSDNLNALGMYRFLDIDSKPDVVYRNNTNGLPVDITGKITPPTINSTGYIGYNRTVIFDKLLTQGKSIMVHSWLLPDKKRAQDFVNKWMNSVYGTVYENLTLNCLVTRPLHESTFFQIAIEASYPPSDKDVVNTSSSPHVILDTKYYYNNITYIFDLAQNFIKANISGSKKNIAND
jgi:hypothetical protein